MIGTYRHLANTRELALINEEEKKKKKKKKNTNTPSTLP
jgi:hypothetical protein